MLSASHNTRTLVESYSCKNTIGDDNVFSAMDSDHSAG